MKGGNSMISKNRKREPQMQIVSLEQLVPEDHLLRKIDAAVDFDFIYDLVEGKYSTETGRPSIDPVTLIKIPIIQYMFGIKSMRQTIKEIEVNVAYRWFLGLDFYDKVPHFSTFGKNYKRRFEGTDLFEQIFQQILLQCMKNDLVNTDTMFIDEGFGSLDEESLHQAMKALSTLSQNNKLIGIISHVSELKNQIDRQIIVKKDKDGSSHIKILI